jgi:hypothetical protein
MARPFTIIGFALPLFELGPTVPPLRRGLSYPPPSFASLTRALMRSPP